MKCIYIYLECEVGTWLKLLGHDAAFQAVKPPRLAVFCVTIATIPFMTGFFFVDQMLGLVKFPEDAPWLAMSYGELLHGSSSA